jgi:DNA-directed RNA polymerase subunit RPC12/RpoP
MFRLKVLPDAEDGTLPERPFANCPPMEPFDVACPECEKRLRVKLPSLVGRTVSCPNCKHRFVIERPAHLSDDEISFNHGGPEAVSSIFAPAIHTGVDSDVKSAPASPKASQGKRPTAMGPAHRTRPRKSNPFVAAALGGIIPIGLGVIFYFMSLPSTQPRSNPQTNVPRQDATRFRQLGEEASTVKWEGAAPVELERQVAKQLQRAQDDGVAVAELQTEFDAAQRQHNNNRLTHVEYQQALVGIQQRVHQLLRPTEDLEGGIGDAPEVQEGSGR